MTTAVRTLEWRLHLTSPPEKVHDMLASAKGRARFWAESAETVGEYADKIAFHFANGDELGSTVVENSPPHQFAVTYWAQNKLTFTLEDDGRGGTDLTMREFSVPKDSADRDEMRWISVLLALKAAVDFNVDLRNHDADRTWDGGFVDY